MVPRVEHVAEAEIDDLDISSLADQDVLDLQVSMNDAVSMAVVQSARDLPAELPRLLLL